MELALLAAQTRAHRAGQPAVGVVASPSLGQLNGVVATTAADVWGVGQIFGAYQLNETLAVHWTGAGATGRVVGSPNPGTTSEIGERLAKAVSA